MPVSYGIENLPSLENQNAFFVKSPCGIFKVPEGQDSMTFPVFIEQGKDMYLHQPDEEAHMIINFDTFDWCIEDISSTFQHAPDLPDTKDVDVEIIGNGDSAHVPVRISNLSEGEVVLIKLTCLLKDSTIGVVQNPSSEIPEEEQDPEYQFLITCVVAVYKGDPINVRHPIFSSNNGKIERSLIYDKPVEQLLQSVYLGSSDLFAPPFHTANLYKESISEYLERHDLEKSDNLIQGSLFTNPKDTTFRNIGSPEDQDQDPEDAAPQFDPNEFDGGDEIEDDDVPQGSLQVASDFAQDELVFYAHGRSIDMDSIHNLLYQHPGNYLGEEEFKPDPELYRDALMNAYMQSPGYNSFIFPLLNPVYIDESISEPIYFFPGRSSHGGGGGRRICRTRTRYRRITIGGGYRKRPRRKLFKITRKVCITIPCGGGPNSPCRRRKRAALKPKNPRRRRDKNKKDKCKRRKHVNGCVEYETKPRWDFAWCGRSGLKKCWFKSGTKKVCKRRAYKTSYCYPRDGGKRYEYYDGEEVARRAKKKADRERRRKKRGKVKKRLGRSGVGGMPNCYAMCP